MLGLKTYNGRTLNGRIDLLFKEIELPKIIQTLQIS
jgi:hypothetical protein